MFRRAKVSGNHANHTCLRIVENRREGAKKRVIATLGRLDRLKESGALKGLVVSLHRFTVGSDGAPDGGQRRTDGNA